MAGPEGDVEVTEEKKNVKKGGWNDSSSFPWKCKLSRLA